MAKSSIRSLRVQASQSVDLAFNMPGVIAWQNYDHTALSGPANLGQRVAKFDVEGQVYPVLNTPHSTIDGMLKYDASELAQLLKPNSLFVIRNAGLGASLDQMLQQRRGAYLDKFKHRSAIQTQVSAFVPAMIAHLTAMRTAGTSRFQQIDAAYGAGSVEKTTKTQTTAPITTSKTSVNPVSTITTAINKGGDPIDDFITTTVNDGGGAAVQSQTTPRTVGAPATLQGKKWTPAEMPFDTQIVETRTAGPQDMISDLPAYSHPKLENVFGYNQAMVALLPELLRQQTTELKLADISTILSSELNAMDLEVRNLQLNFVHTYLAAPLDGIVTGVFKDVGETVEPGEPVIRIENDTTIFVVGRVQHQGPLWVNRQVAIDLKSIFDDGTSLQISGPIVAIRGHENDNDEWEIIFRCQNPTSRSGQKVLPLNYHFDPDTDIFNAL